ncbi:MAG: hypothetical protein KGJ86_00165 [Chloroflexota bacterium]|nr:hypothetical protein [Chloroflexota bacterium]
MQPLTESPPLDNWDDPPEPEPVPPPSRAISLVLRDTGEVLPDFENAFVTPEFAKAALPEVSRLLTNLKRFVAACEEAILAEMQADGASEIPGYAIERRTTYVIHDPRTLKDQLLALVDQGKLTQKDFHAAVSQPEPVLEPAPTFDNRVLNRLITKAGTTVADVIKRNRSELPGAPRLVFKEN